MTIKIIPNDKGNPSGKLADVELLFDAADDVLEGLKLIGFAVWERRTSAGRNVTFLARQYSVNGSDGALRSCGRLQTSTLTTAFVP
jgi:hypothetical protein